MQLSTYRLITPQPIRVPALPLMLAAGWLPSPPSSVLECTTKVRFTILVAPVSAKKGLDRTAIALPEPSILILPRSPVWLLASIPGP